MMSLACFILLCSPYAPGEHDAHLARAESIITNIESNERLYDNIDVRWRKTYRLDRTRMHEPLDELYITKVFVAHVVQQGRLFRESYSESGSNVDGPTLPVVGTNAFDGTRTLQTVADIVNIRDRESRYCHYFLSHISLTANGMIPNCLPLSTWLKGRAAIETHPFGKPSKDRYLHHQVVHEGSTTIDGLTAEILRCDAGESESNFMRLRLYLAPDRNYLPIRAEFSEASTKYCRRIEVHTWTQLESHVWLPSTATKIYFFGVDASAAKVEPYAVEYFELLDAKLNPNYPVEFFRDVPLPTNATVYEYVDGTVVNKYKLTPFTRLDGVPDVWRTFWRWLAVGLAAIAVALAVFWFRARRMRSVSAGAA